MSASLRLREIHFPALHTDTAKAERVIGNFSEKSNEPTNLDSMLLSYGASAVAALAAARASPSA